MPFLSELYFREPDAIVNSRIHARYYYRSSCGGDRQQKARNEPVMEHVHRDCAFAAHGALVLISTRVGVRVVEVEVAAG
jgi:hypothetical protein